MFFSKSIYALLIMFLSVSVIAQHEGALSEGSKAPNFKVNDVYGNAINLRKTAKKQEEGKVLLSFMRHAWCPVCNARTHELIENYEDITNKGYKVIVVFQSPNNRLLNYVKDYDLPFTVISDYEQKLYEEYALEYNGEKMTEATMGRAQIGMGIIGSEENMAKYKGEDDEKDTRLTLVPGDFIINAKGVIERVHYGEFIGDHLPIDEL